MSGSQTYQQIVATACGEHREEGRARWALECAIRREKGRTDYERLTRALAAMVESGRLVVTNEPQGNCTRRPVWRLARGRR
jgi:hypothetical protein